MGYYEGQNVYTRTFKVASGTTILKGTFVKLDTDGRVVPAGLGERAIGVALEDYNPTGGSAPYVWPNRTGVAVRLIGTALVEAGAALTPGAQVASDANGKAKPAATGEAVLGVALRGAAAGEFVEVLLK
ncbi:Burkholderia phage BcepMu gp35-like protein [Thermus phage MN1]|nr:Burkholderia phage BcepMu gp35-like protein [Thermus phage MN1]